MLQRVRSIEKKGKNILEIKSEIGMKPKIYVKTYGDLFPDIFKELEDGGLLIANGIEALNVLAYGNAGIVKDLFIS